MPLTAGTRTISGADGGRLAFWGASVDKCSVRARRMLPLPLSRHRLQPTAASRLRSTARMIKTGRTLLRRDTGLAGEGGEVMEAFGTPRTVSALVPFVEEREAEG